MPASVPVLALCADVVGSRRQPGRAAAFLHRLPAVLDAASGPALARPFATVRGDEVEGQLGADANPFRPIVAAALEPDGLPLRWAVVAGEPSSAPARAAAAVLALKATEERLVVVSGDPRTDALLHDLAPLVGILVDEMTARQRDVTRRILVEGRRQAAVAAELGVSRATISVAVGRGRVRDLERAMRGLAALHQDGMAAAADR